MERLFLFLLSVAFAAGCHSKALASTDAHYCDGRQCAYFKAVDFAPLESLDRDEAELFRSHLKLQAAIGMDGGGTTFVQWAEANDDFAAAALALFQAMRTFETIQPDGEHELITHWVKRITHLAGDRIMVTMDRVPFEHWALSGGAFLWRLPNGKTERGRMNFADHTRVAGSLHSGYDIQGYTSAHRVPRLQINYRFSDAEADIDLDGYAPYIGGVVPNPVHLTYANSDVRQWVDEYTRKFGPPPFKTQWFTVAQE